MIAGVMACQGAIQLSHGAWYLRYYVGTKQRRFLLGYKRDFMTTKAVREAADRKLMELRLVSSGSMARITLVHQVMVSRGGSRFAATFHGERLLRVERALYIVERALYIKDRTEAKKPPWKCKTRDVQNLLGGIPHLRTFDGQKCNN
jgi:hypothetical protein